MLIKHHIEYAFPLKGRLNIPDVLGMSLGHQLKAGTRLQCTFVSPEGQQFQLAGKVAFELINYKGRAEDVNRTGGSLIFDELPGSKVPTGWDLYVLVEESNAS
jgi:hypothetical protein